ncbi:hypothetical protein Tco_1117549 [Tanacetum coccineum]
MKNPVFHGRSKHIDIKYHFIRECMEREDIQVEFINGEYQKADILTKALPKIRFLTMRQLIGLKDLSSSACDEDCIAFVLLEYDGLKRPVSWWGITTRLVCAAMRACSRGVFRDWVAIGKRSD